MRFLLSGLMLFVIYSVKGQSGILYPDVFSTYFYNMALVNPSYVPEEGNVDLMAVHKFRRGLLSDVSTFAATGQRAWRTEKKPTRVARLIFINEREGPYISSPKFYGNYAMQLPLSSEASLMAGVSLGFSGVNFSAPSGAGSLMLLDGGVGLGLKYKKINIGASSMQAFNSEGTVISSIIRLQRFYNINASGETSISPSLDLKGYFLWRSLTALPDQYILATSLFYRRFFEGGALYAWNKGASFFGALTLNPEENALFMSVTYNSGFLSSNPVWAGSLELGLQYRVK